MLDSKTGRISARVNFQKGIDMRPSRRRWAGGGDFLGVDACLMEPPQSIYKHTTKYKHCAYVCQNAYCLQQRSFYSEPRPAFELTRGPPGLQPARSLVLATT